MEKTAETSNQKTAERVLILDSLNSSKLDYHQYNTNCFSFYDKLDENY